MDLYFKLIFFRGSVSRGSQTAAGCPFVPDRLYASPMNRPWHIARPDPDTVNQIARSARIDPLTAMILANRGITAAEAPAFLNPSFQAIRPPEAVKDLHIAAERIAEALHKKERMLVFGDYDVDGVTATTLLVDFLRQAGGWVDFYIPHRVNEGYGLQPDHIKRVALKSGAALIVTVDCGITSFEAVQKASEAGLDVIITDHHIPSGRLPEALAIVNPKRADCEACLDHLAGVGMAFYLLILLRKRLRDRGFWENGTEPNLKQACDLVALGTVADMVPLLGENRAFTRAGLEIMGQGLRPGIQALVEVSRLDASNLDAEDIAFRLAPRINAAGRLDYASTAVELLLTDDPEKARNLGQVLDKLNGERQAVERRILGAIDDVLATAPGSLDRSTIVLAEPDWHEGVLGIVASRIARRHGRPTLLFAVRDGLARGSARSVEGLDLYAALEACSPELLAFGGHAMAAGLKVRADNLERFRDRFEAVVSDVLRKVPVAEALNIDAEIDLTRADPRMLNQFERLKPFGHSNPEPVLMARNLEIEGARMVGGRHWKFVLKQKGAYGTARIPAIEFNSRLEERYPEKLNRAAFHLRWNRWNGTRTLQAVISGIEPV